MQIDGKLFETRVSEGDIYHDGIRVLEQCLRLRTADSEAVLQVLRQICDAIDRALGLGTVKKLAGDAPVTMAKALKWLNDLIASCAEDYFCYIQREYLPGGVDK